MSSGYKFLKKGTILYVLAAKETLQAILQLLADLTGVEAVHHIHIIMDKYLQAIPHLVADVPTWRLLEVPCKALARQD